MSVAQQMNHQKLTLHAEKIPGGRLGVAANEPENGRYQQGKYFLFVLMLDRFSCFTDAF